MKKKVEKQWMRGGVAKAVMAKSVTALAVLSFSLLLPCGCSSDLLPDETDNTSVNNESVPVTMDASLDAETVSAPASRAATTSSLAVNGKVVKLFLIDANTSGTKYANRYQEAYTYSSSAGAWQATQPFYLDSRKANIYAVHDPNNVAAFATNSTKTASESSLSVYINDDTKLWYYDNTKTNINNTNAQLSFTLKCAYSRLTLSLSKTSDYPNACKVSRISIKPSSGVFAVKATVNIADGSLTSAQSSPYTVSTTSWSMYTNGLTTTADTSFDRLFPAQKLAAGAGLTFTLNVDGVDYSVTVPSTKFNEFKRGVRHTANLVMSGSGISISSVSTTDWPAAQNVNVDSTFD